MMAAYIEPHNGAGKLAIIPKENKRRGEPRTKDRNFINRLITFDEAQFIPRNSFESKASKRLSAASCRSQSSEVLMNNERFKNYHDHNTNFGSNESRSINTNTKRSILKGSSEKSLHLQPIIEQTSARRTKSILKLGEELGASARKVTTTVTVHLTDKQKANSTPDLKELPPKNNHQVRIDDKRIHSFAGSETRPFPWLKYISEHDRTKSATSIVPEMTLLKQPENFCKSTNTLSTPRFREEKVDSELNSLQVFRQQKYKNRNKAEKKIQRVDHLNKNEKCNELVYQLRNGFFPHMYENIEKLRFIDYLNEDFVTSSKVRTNFDNRLKKTINSEPIYTEIYDNKLNNREKAAFKSPVPLLKKKVTFSTFHEPILEKDLHKSSKKVFPGTFLGICFINEQMRSKSDAMRRNMATICYWEILLGSKNSVYEFISKLDVTRKGEEMYVVLDDSSLAFEIRDSAGLVVAWHKLTDVSVLGHIPEDPNVFVYIARCKINGRIGLAIRLTKNKYLSYVINYFKRNK